MQIQYCLNYDLYMQLKYISDLKILIVFNFLSVILFDGFTILISVRAIDKNVTGLSATGGDTENRRC